MPRYFTLEQATALLPTVETQLRQAIRLKEEYIRAEESIRAIAGRVTMMGGMVVDRGRLVSIRARCDATSSRLKEVLESIQETGCQIKDLDSGLLDFPTLLDGKEVLLCWRLGESAIEYWHGLEEGFQGRKPIDGDFIAKHRGDPSA